MGHQMSTMSLSAGPRSTEKRSSISYRLIAVAPLSQQSLQRPEVGLEGRADPRRQEPNDAALPPGRRGRERYGSRHARTAVLPREVGRVAHRQVPRSPRGVPGAVAERSPVEDRLDDVLVRVGAVDARAHARPPRGATFLDDGFRGRLVA